MQTFIRFDSPPTIIETAQLAASTECAELNDELLKPATPERMSSMLKSFDRLTIYVHNLHAEFQSAAAAA